MLQSWFRLRVRCALRWRYVSPRRLTEPPRTCGVRVFSAACLTKTAMTGLHRHGVFDVPRNVTASIPPTLAGRGGSVSRRDLNQAAGIRAQLAWGRKSGGAAPPIPSYSSGEGGLGGEALLLEKRPLPPVVPHPALREGARGRGFSQRSRLPRISFTSYSSKFICSNCSRVMRTWRGFAPAAVLMMPRRVISSIKRPARA